MWILGFGFRGLGCRGSGFSVFGSGVWDLGFCLRIGELRIMTVLSVQLRIHTSLLA